MLVDASADFTLPVLLYETSGAAAECDALPTFRVYGLDGELNGNGTAAKLDTGVITDASDATPIVVTSNAHGLSVGSEVAITGVGGNTGANGRFSVSAVTANTFTLADSAGTGAYTAGGVWHAAGLFGLTFDATLRSGLEVGRNYAVVVRYAVSGMRLPALLEFTVVD